MVQKDKNQIVHEKEIYILKILRRGSSPEEALVGIIEDVKGNKKGAFRNGKELLEWLDVECENNQL